MRNNIKSIDWKEVQKQHNIGVYWNNLPKMFGISRGLLNHALKLGLLTKIFHKRIHTKETIELMSTLKIKFLKENPDRHPWKKSSKFRSAPCEKFKSFLISNNINFIGEYQPLDDKFYNIDISFPDKKIGIEINGNQHYNRDGSLKQYYKKRHDEIENAGWKLFEIHYSKVYNEEFLADFLTKLKDMSLENVDYNFYIKEKKIKTCMECDKQINMVSIRCQECNRNVPRKRKFEITREELEKLITEKPYTEIAKMFGVSDNAIRRRAKNLGILLENRLGYWAKINRKI